MAPEATMILVDNSEYMRNGDYQPTRFEAMADAVHAVFTTKIDTNVENSAGLMSMAGKASEVHVTHTREIGHIMQALHAARTKLGGSVDMLTALSVAQLALKHRSNKSARQRIVIFIGSPPEGHGCDAQSLQRLGKKLKKNNIAVDIVAFGDAIEDGETSALKGFVDTVNSNDNSHYVPAPPEPRRLLSDMVVSSSLLAEDRGIRDEAMADITNAAGTSGNLDDYGGIDPNVDPELAMAIRMSMEEERARQRAQEQAVASAASPSEAQASTSASPTPREQTVESSTDSTRTSTIVPPPATNRDADIDADREEEDEIARAIAMSMEQGQDDQQQEEQ